MAKYPFTCGLVTGASSGIGYEIAVQLASAGVPLVVVARRSDRLKELSDRFKRVEVICADLTTDSGIELIEARLVDVHKPQIDLVVNNAGFGTSGFLQNLDIARLTREINLNVTALTRISHRAVAMMVPLGRGYLLNVSSVAGFQSGPRMAVYSATKAFVTSFTEAVHEELRGTGVRVTALCPGLTRTEFQSISNTSNISANFPEFAWLSASHVARIGLRDVVRGKALSIPGMQYKALTTFSSLAPRRVVRFIARLTLGQR